MVFKLISTDRSINIIESKIALDSCLSYNFIIVGFVISKFFVFFFATCFLRMIRNMTDSGLGAESHV